MNGTVEGLVERLRDTRPDAGFSGLHTTAGEMALALEAASRIEQLEAQLVASREALRDLVAAIETPRCGDDSIWDDIMGYDGDGGPLGRAHAALTIGVGD